MKVYCCCLPLIGLKDIIFLLLFFNCGGGTTFEISASIVSLICDILSAFALSKISEHNISGKFISIIQLLLHLGNFIISIYIMAKTYFGSALQIVVVSVLSGVPFIIIGIVGFYTNKRKLLVTYALFLPISLILDSFAITFYMSINTFIYSLAPITCLVADLTAALAVYSFLYKSPRIHVP